MWKRLLPKEIEDGSHGIMEYILTWCNHSTPSISGEGKSASGHLVDNIKELAFMRIREICEICDLCKRKICICEICRICICKMFAKPDLYL